MVFYFLPYRNTIRVAVVRVRRSAVMDNPAGVSYRYTQKGQAMILRTSVLFVVTCGLVLPQSLPATEADQIQSVRKRFPPEILMPTAESEISGAARKMCAQRSPQTQSVSFRRCPAQTRHQLLPPADYLPLPVPSKEQDRR
jgi:hypothetical protein